MMTDAGRMFHARQPNFLCCDDGDRPILTKPYKSRQLAEALARLMAPGPPAIG